MPEVVAIIKVENLPLYKDMAEFIVHLAQWEDKNVPSYVAERAQELTAQIWAMLEKREKPS